jgi:phosphate-selective porin OprO and OprP
MRNCLALASVAGAALGMAAAAGAQTLDSSRAYSAELLADSQNRTSALAQQPEAFSVKVGGQIQFRYIYTDGDDIPGDENEAAGFQTRRTKLNFSGNVIDKTWEYQILAAFNRATGQPVLENAFVKKSMENGWYVQFGQFKLPFLREENMSSTRQLASDRTATNNFFTQAFSQGIEIGTGGKGEDNFRIAGAFSDGLRSSNTDIGMSPADYALTGRAEYRIAGDWRQFRQFTSFRNADFGALLGGAVHWQSGGDTLGTPDVDVLSATADLSLVGNGWNFYAAGIWANTDPEGGTDTDDFGVVLQGGFFVTDQTELFARYDATIADDDRALDDFHTLTVGVNHYFSPESHAAKLTVDLQYLFDAPAESLTPSASSLRGIGVLAGDRDDGQIALRAQFQLLF